MSVQSNTVSRYCVEISGWDVEENFFVERTDLEWFEEHGKRVALRKPVREGSLVFVRLLEPADAQTAFPVAYKAGCVEKRQNNGPFEISLIKMWPRSRRGPVMS
ncbi:MAG: hypothetical protein HY234_10405 [Acidobacteria bacterium]|nr:hypothetical protein [Acidobacteriota bacterium]